MSTTRTISAIHLDRRGPNGRRSPNGDLSYHVGKDVLSIIEHAAQGEGDRWYYDVEFSDGHKERVFNVISVVWSAPPTVHPIFEPILDSIMPKQ